MTETTSITPLRHSAKQALGEAAGRIEGKPGLSRKDQISNLKKSRKAALQAVDVLTNAIEVAKAKKGQGKNKVQELTTF